MSKHSRVIAFALLLAGAAPASAARVRKWPFFEGTAGTVVPIGAKAYQDTARISPLGGFRAGAYFEAPGAPHRIGFEIGFDFTYLFNGLARDQFADSDIYRLRLMGGARYEVPVGGRAYAFGRVMGGVDMVIGSVDDYAAGTYIREEAVSLGPVVSPGGGLVWRFDDFNIGAQGGLPISYHYDGDHADRTPDFDYLGIELEALFSIGGEW